MKAPRIALTAMFVLVTSAVWAPSSEGGTDPIAVIVNTGNPANALEANELRHIFQTQKSRWSHGGDATPVNLPEDNPLRQDFDRAVLGLDPERAARYWTDRQIRGGARPPIRVSTTSAMLTAVASKVGAVGYVKASEVNSTVKVVAKISDGNLSPP